MLTKISKRARGVFQSIKGIVPALLFGIAVLAYSATASAVPTPVTPADGVDVVGMVAGVGTSIFTVIAAVLGVGVAVLTVWIGWKYVRGLKKS